MKLARSKKGDAFTIILTILAISILMLILVGVLAKRSALSSDPVGADAIYIFQQYDKADTALTYLDNSARLSAYQAASDFAANGFDVSGCGVFKNLQGSDYNGWSMGSAAAGVCTAQIDSCIPGSFEAGKLNERVLQELNSYIDSYNEGRTTGIIPKGHDITLSEVDGSTEILGILKRPLRIESQDIVYDVEPSFRESIGINLISDFNKVAAKAPSLIGADDASIESQGLKWDIDVQSQCSKSCSLGRQCDTACESAKLDPDCDDLVHMEDFGTGCPRTKSCSSGALQRQYCDVTAFVTVRIIDDAHKLPGERIGLKKIIDANEVKDFEYRFALNWVEVGDEECVAD